MLNQRSPRHHRPAADPRALLMATMATVVALGALGVRSERSGPTEEASVVGDLAQIDRQPVVDETLDGIDTFWIPEIEFPQAPLPTRNVLPDLTDSALAEASAAAAGAGAAPSASTTTEPAPTTQAAAPDPEPEPEQQSAPEPDPEPAPAPQPDPEPQPEPTAAPAPEPAPTTTEAVDTSESTSTEAADETDASSESAPSDDSSEAEEPAPTTTAAPEPEPAPAPSGLSDDQLYTLRMCESTDNYAINTGNGYFGAYQFDQSTWNSVIGSVDSSYNGVRPDQAPAAVQDAAVRELHARRGVAPWPTCGRKL